jgi:hypothetical protein
MRGNTEYGGKDFGKDCGPVTNQRLQEAHIAGLIRRQGRGRGRDAAFEHAGGLSVEGMDERNGRLNPFQTMTVEGEGLEEGGRDSHRMHC